MADFSLEDLKTLRVRLGTGMVETKNALVEAGGDLDKATELLRLKGAKGNAKRADRSTSEGLVAAKENGSTTTLIELSCETDFVAKGEKFVTLGDTVLDAIVAAGASTPEEGLAAPTGSAIPACVATLVDTLPGDVYLPERLPLGLETSLATGYSVTVSADTREVTPCDPNLITGPVGYGP